MSNYLIASYTGNTSPNFKFSLVLMDDGKVNLYECEEGQTKQKLRYTLSNKQLKMFQKNPKWEWWVDEKFWKKKMVPQENLDDSGYWTVTKIMQSVINN